MPQLPALLLSSIIRTLIAPSKAPISKEDLVEWATWILDQSSALSKKQKAEIGLPKFIETGANVQMHAVFPQETLKELAHLCMRSRIDGEYLLKLVSHLSPLVNDSSFRRRAELLAKCSLSSSPEFEESGREHKLDSIQNDADGELTVDTAFVEARELQQMSIAKYVADVKLRDAMGSSAAAAGPWSKAKSWTPCAIGMLPSAFGHESIIPQFDLKAETRDAEPSPDISLSSLFSNPELKRKAPEESELETDSKRVRVEDQLMDDEAKITTDETRAAVDPMDEDTVAADTFEDDEDAVADTFDGGMDYTMSFGSKPEVTTVTWQGCLLQRGVLQMGGLQELPSLQAAIRVL
jgi:ribosomal biogenesis protein LAS1